MNLNIDYLIGMTDRRMEVVKMRIVWMIQLMIFANEKAFAEFESSLFGILRFNNIVIAVDNSVVQMMETGGAFEIMILARPVVRMTVI